MQNIHDRKFKHRQFPPSLTSLKSEFEELCYELGGPADVGLKVDTRCIDLCCQDYPVDQLLPILLSFQEDEIRARRHWPWAAWAISQYDFEKRELAKYTDEPTPKEVRDLLLKINEAAHDLGSGLVRLNDLSERLADPTAPARRAHLAWLAEFISQFIDGKISNDIGENDRQILANHFKKESLLNYLVNVEVAAKAAMQRVDRSTLERKRGQDPALANFILRCGKIWEGLRGPQAERREKQLDA